MSIRRRVEMILIGLTLLAGIACNLATGMEAYKKMTDEEKRFVLKIEMIQESMTEEQVSEILGPVYRGGGTMRPVWKAPGEDDKSQVAVYYWGGKIKKIRYMKLGSFVWEKGFPPKNPE